MLVRVHRSTSMYPDACTVCVVFWVCPESKRSFGGNKKFDNNTNLDTIAIHRSFKY